MPSLRSTLFAAIMFLCLCLCDGSAAAQGTEDKQQDTTEKVSRQREEYRYLVYKQAIPANPGLRSQLVKQRLPFGLRGPAGNQAVVGGIAKPETIGDPGFIETSSEQIVEPYQLSRNKSIVVEGNQVLLQDKITKQQAVLVKGPEVAELMFASTFARTALSPSGNRLATAVLTSAEGEGVGRSPRYEVFVVDLFAPMVIFPKSTDQILSDNSFQPKLIRKNVRGEAAHGAGLTPHAIAPPLLWLDDQTVLLVTTDDPEGNEDQLNDDGSIPKTYQLLAINAATSTAKPLCKLRIDLPAFRPELLPVLWRRCDRAIMLRNFAIDHRIDLKKGVMVEDRRLSPQYELRGDRYAPSLWSGNVQLCESLYFRNVAVSPDGGCIAWYARSVNTLDKTNLGNTSQHLTTLWFHSPETGAVELAEGNFDSSQPFLKFDNPGYSELFQWLTED